VLTIYCPHPIVLTIADHFADQNQDIFVDRGAAKG
jgi:hypothetical protein